jgi:hypothetical protein
MVGTILPVVYGARSDGRAAKEQWLHLAGSFVAAAGLGLLLGWLGSIWFAGITGTPQVGYALTGLVAATYVLRELRLVPVPAPQRHHQVPAAWRFRFAPGAMAFLYGLGLGPGVFTHIWVSSFYVVLVWVFVSGSPALGLLTLGAFGIARAAPVVLLASRVSDIAAAFRITRRLEIWTEVVHLVDGLALSLAAGVLIGLWLRPI